MVARQQGNSGRAVWRVLSDNGDLANNHSREGHRKDAKPFPGTTSPEHVSKEPARPVLFPQYSVSTIRQNRAEDNDRVKTTGVSLAVRGVLAETGGAEGPRPGFAAR